MLYISPSYSLSIHLLYILLSFDQYTISLLTLCFLLKPSLVVAIAPNSASFKFP